MINLQMEIESSNSEEKKSFSERIKRAYQHQRILIKKEKRKVYYGYDLQKPTSQTELGKRQMCCQPPIDLKQSIKISEGDGNPLQGQIEDVAILIQDTQMYPYSVVGLVQIQSSESVRWTTGCFFDRNCIVTCLPGYQEGGINEQKIYFYPAYNSVSGGVKYRVRNLFRNKNTNKRRSEQKGDGDNNESLMVLELDTDYNFQKNYGCYGLNFLQETEIGEQFILGYRDFPDNKKVLAKCPIKFRQQGKNMHYQLADSGRTLGGPILMYQKQQYYLMGWHIPKVSPTGEYVGVRMSEKIFSWMMTCFKTKEWWVNLQNARLNNFSVRKMAKQNWQDLAYLNLAQNMIGPQGAQSLSRGDWKKLVEINLRNNLLGNEGARHISQGDWKDLLSFDLQRNAIGDDGLEYICQANWRQLDAAFLGHNQITSRGAFYISRAVWPYLTSLCLKSNRIDSQGAAHLSQGVWKYLQFLNLQSNLIMSNGLNHLMNGNWKHLRKLKLQSNFIGDRGLHSFGKSNWEGLNELYVGKNEITYEGIKYLMKIKWKQLKILNMTLSEEKDMEDMHRFELLLLSRYPQTKITI